MRHQPHDNLQLNPLYSRQLPPPTIQTNSTRSIPKISTLTQHKTEIKSAEDLLPPGAEPGTVPTDLEQATGLERLEILGKMQGVDIFDMKPLPSDRVGGYLFF